MTVVSYIKQISNKTEKSMFMWAEDHLHCGTFFQAIWFGSKWEAGGNAGQAMFTVFPWVTYEAEDCGVPWRHEEGIRYRAISSSKNRERAHLIMLQRDSESIDYYSSKDMQGFDKADPPVPRYRQMFDSGRPGDRYILRIRPGAIIMSNEDSSRTERYIEWRDRVNSIEKVELDANKFAQNLAKLAEGDYSRVYDGVVYP